MVLREQPGEPSQKHRGEGDKATPALTEAPKRTNMRCIHVYIYVYIYIYYIYI